jgi:hypothetical protein
MSDLKDFNLATADQHQLRFYAKEELGLQLHHSFSAAKMREKIVEHCKEQGIAAPTATVETKGGQKEHPKIRINIAKQDKKGGGEPAFVGYNGVGYTIPRGIDIDVPAPVVEILKNAKQDIVTQDPDTGEIQHEEVITYPFQVVNG